jgi:hypothetical protein
MNTPKEDYMARPMRVPQEQVAPSTSYSEQAYWLLYSGFIAAPIIAGLDKFFHVLVDWTQYLAPMVPRLTGINAATFMMIVGVIEIGAGIVVAVNPKFGGLLVAAWLWGIIINLLLIPGFYDIALRDFGLSLGALALARLAQEFTS